MRYRLSSWAGVGILNISSPIGYLSKSLRLICQGYFAHQEPHRHSTEFLFTLIQIYARSLLTSGNYIEKLIVRFTK